MNWKVLVEFQIAQHRHVNLMSEQSLTGFRFSPATQALIKKIASGGFSNAVEQPLLEYTVRAVLSSFYRINQYYHFTKKAETELKSIYECLFVEVKSAAVNGINYDALAEQHYLRLQAWLLQNEPEAGLRFPPDRPHIKEAVVCAEYSAATQLKTLHIDISQLQEPILDVGCGKEQHLLKYLLSKDLDAYGIDRDAIAGRRVWRESWLQHSFEPQRWGTVISHLGFTNHFRHQHLKAGDNHLLYAKKYIDILQALVIGGRFFYAPDLPFIEVFLNTTQYTVTKYPIPYTPFRAVCITRNF
jgi:hypothetical protein